MSDRVTELVLFAKNASSIVVNEGDDAISRASRSASGVIGIGFGELVATSVIGIARGLSLIIG